MKKELKLLCKKIADWLNKRIDIPCVPEWVEGIIFNKIVKWIAKIIVESLKKAGGKDA